MDSQERPIPPAPAPAHDLFAGGGETGELLRALDWSATPLGPPEGWPRSLKTCVRIMLTSRQPIWIGWGPELTYMYNDPYKAIIGGKHPDALGQPTSAVWSEIWDVIGPMLATAMSGTEGTYVEAQLLMMERYGYEEETYYTFSYSPVPNDEGGTGGIICANTDDTLRVIGERQMGLLRELAARTAEARTVEDTCARSAAALATNRYDLPFSLIYLLEPDQRDSALLAGAAGIAEGHPAAPARASHDDGSLWPFDEVLRSMEPRVVDLPPGLELPTGPWERPPSRAAVLPIAPSGETGRAGFLVVGLNPFRLFDEGYRGFLSLAAGQISGSIGNAEAYQEERKRAEALAELDRAKTTFFSNVSHEFRTPLTLMLGPMEDLLAGSGGDLPPPASAELERIHRNALRLLRLVNTLLDFSRIEAGRSNAAFEPTDLAAYTAELASTFRSAMDRAGLRLIVDTPPLGEPVYVDREMWEKVVLNFLSNAFKFTLEGEVEVSLRRTGAWVELAVRDTGSGIPADELPHVFERFHRVQGTRGRTHEGTGIGLALVQELVRLHGGEVSAESEPGRGSTFRARIPSGSAHLPRERVGARPEAASTSLGASPFVEEALRWLPAGAERDADAATLAQAGGPAPLERLRDARVLLADDNADMRDYLARLLRQQGLRVEAVADGAEALAAARRDAPDLVLSDVMMPEMDGFQLLQALREDEGTRELPVILLSARAGEEARIEGLEAGADDYLVKPFSARELTARVRTQLEMTALRREANRVLRESEERFRNMADHAPVMIWVTEADGACSYLNRRWYEFTGQTPETGLGLGWLTAVHPDDARRSGDVFLEANRRREPFRLEYRLRRADGEYRWAIDAAIPRMGPGGEFLGYIGSVVDIHERKEAEEERERLLSAAEAARAEAEEANRAKSDFLATMSHELRTPLNAVLGYTDLLTMGLDGPVTERQAAQLGRIQASSRHLLTLISDILDLAKVESGRIKVERGPVTASDPVEQALAVIEPQARQRGIDLDDATRRGDRLRFLGDADRVRQILVNLLANSVKFTEAGGWIRISAEPRPVDEGPAADGGPWLRLDVEDSGRGIAAGNLERIFDPFVQVDSRLTREHPGTGLGLTISRQLARLMGGDLTVTSREGEGSRFSLWLPAAEEGR